MNAPQENRVVSPHVLGEGSPQRQYASKGSHGVAAMALYTFTALSTRHKHGNGKSETRGQRSPFWWSCRAARPPSSVRHRSKQGEAS